MLKIFSEIYPDEIAYSIFARYSVLNGNISKEDTSLELFGIRIGSYNIFYPNHLGYFIKQLPPDLGITTESLINENSLFPLFKPFMNAERAKKIIEKFCNGVTSGIYREMGINSGKIHAYKGQTIKICKKCFKEETDRNKEAYIHRIHQVPGNFICNKHNKYLIEYCVPYNLYINSFFDINDINIEPIEVSNIEIDLLKKRGNIQV